MALKRLLLGICGVVVITSNVVYAQFQPTEANQDGIVVLDALGRFFSADSEGFGAVIFQELENHSQKLGFVLPIIKDLELVGQPDGSLLGAYAVDIFGGQFHLTARDPGLPITNPAEAVSVSSPAEIGSNNPRFSTPVFFGFDVVEDLEIAPDWRDVTFGYKGYFILDADGVVHTLGETNLPEYVYFDPAVANPTLDDATIVPTLYPQTIDISGTSWTPESLLRNVPLNFPANRLFVNQDIESVTPVFTYFGFGSDIARDLEISVDYVDVTIPSRTSPGAVNSRTIAMTNGYYILDGFGAVHSSRLPLDFDVNNDGQVLYTDVYSDFDANELNADFGQPINNLVIAPSWVDNPDELPFFGVDVAVDIEITPTGKGFYLLDSFGGIFAVGDAEFTFPPAGIDEDGNEIPSTSTTPFFGFPIARDLTLVTNTENPSLGLVENRATVGFLVIDGFGSVHEAGIAENFNVSAIGNNGKFITSFSDTFRSVETFPLWLPMEPAIEKFVIGNQNIDRSVAGEFLNVTAAFRTISAPAQVSRPQ